MDGIPTTGDLADAAASTPLNTGGFDFGNILKGAATKGLDALLGNLFGGGSGSKDGNGPFSADLEGLIKAGPAAYFDNELVERATQLSLIHI